MLVAGTEYHVTSVFLAYPDIWVDKNETRHTYLVLQQPQSDGISPLAETCGEDDNIDLHRIEGPNMKVVKCKKNVTLREKPSKKAKSLLKVPLNAKVFAFTDQGITDGFYRCVYNEEYGYILAEYLAPVE